MSDPDQEIAETFDDELLSDEYPPEEPLGVDEEGTTTLEELGGESVAERDERTEPEVWEQETALPAESGPEIEGDADQGVVDDEEDLVAPPLFGEDLGALDPDDEFSGDETTRDVATERVPGPAENAAVRLDDEAPGATE
jgi:hypothetical protein